MSKEPLVITLEGNLTSYYFYNTVLKKMHDYIMQEDIPPLIRLRPRELMRWYCQTCYAWVTGS